ncbi:hypothetical protein OEZ60_14780 [Defluviimonas sp. WL0024]|uniref:C2H2-type domain-containing protein n=1 Tax=Albidovulum salinarum TaxID=2984153 RepID=A0ABT2X5Q2_9RHOB|nr:hypothetical protein [Defluviimonas sp. WL0024]MCU9849266.1 hypothetical protein [Defluviimonas sp. WL0024]
MPTVGWIREGDLDAFYEGTERTPDPGPPKEPSFSCPFCASLFPSQSVFHDHVYAKHRVERPFIMMRGREPSAHAVLRSPLALPEIAVANTSHAMVCLDGAEPEQVSIDRLKKIVAETSQAELKLELVNATEERATPVVTQYGFSFRIAEKADLKRVEEAFREILVAESITRNSIGSFLADKRTQGPGKEYASGLADYCLGILIKERPQGENLTTPFSRYRELYGRALDILKDFPSPLAKLITCIIRFSLNDFENGGERTGYWELDLAIELLSDPSSASLTRRLESDARRPVCPIDHGTGRMLELSKHLTAQPRWSPILDDECRALAHSDLLDATDHQKAFAIWAASAWRLGSTDSALEPLTQIAEIYPFSRWASKYLEQAST